VNREALLSHHLCCKWHAQGVLRRVDSEGAPIIDDIELNIARSGASQHDVGQLSFGPQLEIPPLLTKFFLLV
jgi:hypothetical protein